MGNFDAIIMHLQYYKAFSAIPFENVWIKQNDKTNELLHLFPVSCTTSSRCHQHASCRGATWSWLLAQRQWKHKASCCRQTHLRPSVAELLEEGWFAIAHLDHNFRLIPRDYLSSLSQIFLMRCFYTCLKSGVRYYQRNSGKCLKPHWQREQFGFSTIVMEETHLSPVPWNHSTLVS